MHSRDNKIIYKKKEEKEVGRERGEGEKNPGSSLDVQPLRLLSSSGGEGTAISSAM